MAQRIYGLALGYEDLNDHGWLRLDPLLAAACDKQDPTGQDRFNPAHRGVALAGASTLNRLELSNNQRTRAHKLAHEPEQMQACLLQMGVRCLPKHAEEIVVDLDAMGHRLHGLQEGRHYRAYYDEYCYLPLYVFVGDYPLWAQLRTSDQDGAAGVVAALATNRAGDSATVPPGADHRARGQRFLPGGDHGLVRGPNRRFIIAWVWPRTACWKNAWGRRWRRRKCAGACVVLASVREFAEFEYQTVRSWSRARRVIGKAEMTAQGPNPRFVVTNLPAEGFAEDEDPTRFTPARLYEELYCARGEMENVLKQQVLDLRADRMSTHYLASNQLRLWLAAFAYLLLERVRSLGLAGTELARATVGSVRLRLFKVAAQVRVSVRRVYVQLSSAYPLQTLFRLCQRRLMRLSSASG